MFGEMMSDHGLEQIVKDPTRGANTLDLVLTNNPTSILKKQVIPRIDTTPNTKRQIPIYKKAMPNT